MTALPLGKNCGGAGGGGGGGEDAASQRESTVLIAECPYPDGVDVALVAPEGLPAVALADVPQLGREVARA